MTPQIIKVSHVGDYRLELSFADGLRSIVDFRQRVLSRGGIWSALHSVEYFKQVRIDPELQTIVWPNGVDICPEVLYALAAGHPLPEAQVERLETIRG